jgi:hypothetical protein
MRVPQTSEDQGVFDVPGSLIADLRLSTHSHGSHLTLQAREEILHFVSVLYSNIQVQHCCPQDRMASAVDREKHSDRDSASLERKIDHHGIHQEVVNPLNDIPDPDAGLSEEERAAEVHFSHDTP